METENLVLGGDEIYQHYEILKHEDGRPWELGRGAMGVTYKAIDKNLQVLVALKVINAQLSVDPDAPRRFLREARTAARLIHPNVAVIFHFGKSQANDLARILHRQVVFIRWNSLRARPWKSTYNGQVRFPLRLRSRSPSKFAGH